MFLIKTLNTLIWTDLEVDSCHIYCKIIVKVLIFKKWLFLGKLYFIVNI